MHLIPTSFNFLRVCVYIYTQVFPKGSPMLPSFNEALLKVCESSKLKDIGMLASEKCKEMEDGEGESTLSLSLNSFFVLFTFTGATSTIALVFYLCRGYKSVFRHKNLIWRLMMAVIRHWGDGKRRFSRRASHVPEGRANPLNPSDSNAIV